MPQTYRFKTRPYRHQYEALKQLIANGYGGELFMEPRTGKTKTTIDYAGALATKGRIDKVLIVCPARVMHVWIKEFAAHCPLVFHTTIWDRKARTRTINGTRVPQGPPEPNSAYDLNVVIVNYDAFSTPGRAIVSKGRRTGRRSRASGRFKHRDLLRKWMKSTNRGTLMVLDESHRIAKPSGAAATMLVSMQADPDYRLILTGTPVTKAKKVHDLYMQYKFVDPTRFADLPTHDEFKNAFAKWIHDNGYPQWIAPRNQEILQNRIHQTAVVVRREDCFDLPPKQTIIRKIPLAESADAYDQMAIKMVAEIIDLRRQKQEAEEKGLPKVHIVEASIKLVQGLRLRQITGGVATTGEGRLLVIGHEKIDALRDELEAAKEHDEKLVVTAQFRADLTRITRLCRREFGLKTFILQGGIPLDQSARDIREFERHEGCAVYVVQPQSGSEGIDLSTAPHMVWYSLTPSWVKYTQMNDRIALSRKSTSFTYLLGENTVDEVLYNTLLTDGEVARAILDKPQMLLRDPHDMRAVEALL